MVVLVAPGTPTWHVGSCMRACVWSSTHARVDTRRSPRISQLATPTSVGPCSLLHVLAHLSPRFSRSRARSRRARSRLYLCISSFLGLARRPRRARLENVSCSCGGWRCTSGITPQEVQILKTRARGIGKSRIPNAPCSMLTHQLSLRCSGSLPVVAWAGPAPPPPLPRSSRSC